MSASPDSLTFAVRARWVIPIASPPIARGVVTIRDGRILGLGRDAVDCPNANVVDLGDAALLPGLVNAHTHLEFSDLAAPLGTQGIGICDWIPLVVAERRRAGRDSEAAVRAGLRESARFGVTALGEIAQPDWSAAAIESLPLAVNVYLERIGSGPQRIHDLCAAAEQHMQRTPPPDARWRPGVSPHAPYSVDRAIVDQLVERLGARLGNLPLAMHVAESREELELLATARGPMRDMLAAFGVWREGAFGGLNPADFVRALVREPRSDAPADVAGAKPRRTTAPALVVHGNYLDAESLDLLAASQRPVCVVYCPRTHAFFGHARYPLAELRRRGIAVAIGTDSRASNPDLSVLAELRFVVAEFPDVPAADVLRMGTLSGATALGRERECGSIEVGKAADLAAVRLDADHLAANSFDAAAEPTPHEQVLRSDGDVLATIAAGKAVYDPLGLIARASPH